MAKKGFSVFFFFVLFLFCFFSCVICGSAVQCFLNTLPTVVCDVWINSKSVKLWRLIDCVWRNESISVLQSRVMCARGSDWNALCPDFKRKVKKKGYFSVEGRRKPASEFSDGMLLSTFAEATVPVHYNLRQMFYFSLYYLFAHFSY